MSVLTSWRRSADCPELDDDQLPRDLTPGGCRARWHFYTCTRAPGHTGRHAAGTEVCIVAVWSDEDMR